MASAKGCFKNGCFGCLGMIVLVLIIGGVSSLVAWNDTRKVEPVDTVLAPEEPAAIPDNTIFRRGGTVRLDLSEGEFTIYPAGEGEGLRVEAVYDDNLYDLTQDFEVLADSTWTYDLQFHQTETGFRGFMRSIFARGPSTELKIFLPRDVPLDLVTRIAKGGVETELGGLWLRSADLEGRMGGFALAVSRPLREPMESLRIRTSMGGFEAEGLGNASPRRLDVASRMGGGDVGMNGAWLNDCQARFSVNMGGLAVRMPRDVEYEEGWPEAGLEVAEEIGADPPVIYLVLEQQRGEIDVMRR